MLKLLYGNNKQMKNKHCRNFPICKNGIGTVFLVMMLQRFSI